MMQHTWQTTPIDLNEWLVKYAKNRYKTDDKSLVEAWQVLRQTVYNGKDIRDGAESIITGRPTFDSTTVWTKTKLNYKPKDLIPAWDLFVEASKKGIDSDGFQYDLVDITRQVLANHALILQKKWKNAYKAKDEVQFKKDAQAFIDLIADMDELLATRKDFMLGPWINSARSWGSTPTEKALYEQNARDLITLWGDANNPLHEYSNRQWSGLLNDFYKPRWQQFFVELNKSLAENREPNLKTFDANIRTWEWNWVKTQKNFPTTTKGNSHQVALKMYKKYRNEL